MLTLDFIRLAEARIRPFVHRTPVATSRTFHEAAGRRVFFNCENFQRAGAFKMRGATNKILSLADDERARGVAAFSTGNHAHAVAFAARAAGAGTGAKGVRHDIRCVPVESELSDDTRQSFVKGERVTIPPPPTIADGMRTQTPGALTFPILRENAEDVLAVSEDEIIETL